MKCCLKAWAPVEAEDLKNEVVDWVVEAKKILKGSQANPLLLLRSQNLKGLDSDLDLDLVLESLMQFLEASRD